MALNNNHSLTPMINHTVPLYYILYSYILYTFIYTVFSQNVTFKMLLGLCCDTGPDLILVLFYFDVMQKISTPKFLNFKGKEKKLIQIYILLLFQPSDNVEVCQFELRNESRWKSMSQDAILSVCGPGSSPCWPTLPPLCSSTLDSTLVSNDVEQQLRILLFEHRRVRSFIT
jgi:hypothetical protein